MKKLLLTLIIALFGGYISTAQSWQVVGQPGFSEGLPHPFLFRQSLALDNNGIPYVAYAEYISEEDGVRGVVKKFENNAWETVGGAFYENSGGNSLFLFASLIFNSNNIPYIAFSDQSNSGKLAVKKFEAGIWQSVGTPWITANYAGHNSLVFDGNGIPYVSFADGTNSDKATVMKFENNVWQVVGTAGFSAGEVSYTSLAMDSNNTPYIGYSDNFNLGKATAMKFIGGSWQSVGPAEGFSSSSITAIFFAISSDNVPYAAYRIYVVGPPNTQEFRINKFGTNGWESEGPPLLESPVISFAFHNDIPYVACFDIENDGKATLKKLIDGSWQVVGQQGFTAVTAYVASVAINDNGLPYVVFNDGANDNRVTVMKYGSTMSIDDSVSENTFLYPNPATDSVTITTATDQSMVKIIDVTGKLVYSTLINNQGSIDTSAFANGVYFVQISNENQPLQTKKLVVHRN